MQQVKRARRVQLGIVLGVFLEITAQHWTTLNGMLI